MAEEMSLATLGRSVLDFLRTPYRPPNMEDRTPQVRPVRQTPLDAFVQNAAKCLAALPQRAFESANTFYETGSYDPAPIMESAMTAVTSGMPFAVRGALGSSGGRMTSLPMDQASRMQRADAMGMRRGIDLFHGTGKTFDEFRAVPTDVNNLQTPEVSLALNPEIANEFAFASRGNAKTNQPQVHKVWHRAERPVQLQLTGRESHAQVVETLREAFDSRYDAVKLRNYTSPDGAKGDIIIVRDGNQLRSPNAIFDPAKRSSRDLLANRRSVDDILNGIA